MIRMRMGKSKVNMESPSVCVQVKIFIFSQKIIDKVRGMDIYSFYKLNSSILEDLNFWAHRP